MLDDTEKHGHGSGHQDCFQALPSDRRAHVCEVLANQSIHDAANVMGQYGMCVSCVMYYMFSSVAIFFKRNEITDEQIISASSFAVAHSLADDV